MPANRREFPRVACRRGPVSDAAFAVCILDMDGTLLDSSGMWDVVSEQVLAPWGKVCTSREREDTMTMTVDGTAAYYVQHFSLPIPPEQMAASIRQHARRAYATLARVKPGVPRRWMPCGPAGSRCVWLPGRKSRWWTRRWNSSGFWTGLPSRWTVSPPRQGGTGSLSPGCRTVRRQTGTDYGV